MKNRVFLLLSAAGCAAVLLAHCGRPGHGPLVAKIKGLKLYQGNLDSQFSYIKDDAERDKRIRSHVNEALKTRAYALEALQTREITQAPDLFDVMESRDRFVLFSIFRRETLQKNWGFQETDLIKYYQTHQKEYQDTVPPADTLKKTPPQVRTKSFAEVREQVVRAHAASQVTDSALATFLRAQNPNQTPDLSPANREMAVRGYLDSYSQNLDSIFFARYKEKYQARISKAPDSISAAAIEAFYRDNADLFRNPPLLVAAHIEMDDFDKAEKTLQKLKRGASFSALVKSASLNKTTRARDGKLDTLRPDQDLRDVEGPTATFYKRLAKLKKGELSDIFTVFLSGTAKHYHIFKILEVVSQGSRPLDSVRDTIRTVLASRDTTALPESFVIATIQGRPVTVAEINKMLSRLPPERARVYRTREGSYQLLNYYLRFTVFDMEAKETGFTDLPETKRQRQEDRDRLLAEEYTSKYLQPYAGLDPREVRKYFEKQGGLVIGPSGDTLKTLETALNVVLKKMLVSEKMVEDYYHVYQEDFEKSPGVPKPLDEVRSNIESRLFSHEREFGTQIKTASLLKKFGGRIYPAKYREPGARMGAQQYMDEASRLHEEKDLYGSVKMLQEIRFQHPQSDLLDDLCLTIAQIYIEQKKYQDAINEYHRLLRLYPKSAHNYKAQFMIGFVYSENLKDKDQALAAYRAVIAQYPQCDLADDAQFMINSLESGEEFNIPDLPEEPAPAPAPAPAAPAAPPPKS